MKLLLSPVDYLVVSMTFIPSSKLETWFACLDVE